jgi:hypothetical protein
MLRQWRGEDESGPKVGNTAAGAAQYLVGEVIEGK